MNNSKESNFVIFASSRSIRVTHDFMEIHIIIYVRLQYDITT